MTSTIPTSARKTTPTAIATGSACGWTARSRWPHDDGWRRDLRYESESLVTHVTCVNDRLGIKLVCADYVDVGRNVYVKRVEVRDRRGQGRRVRLFQHIDLHLWGNNVGDTAFYDPDAHTLVSYKGRRYLMLGAQTRRRRRAHSLGHRAAPELAPGT